MWKYPEPEALAKAIFFPLGEMEGSFALDRKGEGFRSDRFIVQISGAPLTSLTNAIAFPSGNHVGEESSAGSLVRGTAVFARKSVSQIFRFPEAFEV
jgi:hypothetical protein